MTTAPGKGKRRSGTAVLGFAAMSSAEQPLPPHLDPRVPKVRRIVRGLAVVVGIILAGAAVLGAYTVVTERPAREMFFEPNPPPEE